MVEIYDTFILELLSLDYDLRCYETVIMSFPSWWFKLCYTEQLVEMLSCVKVFHAMKDVLWIKRKECCWSGKRDEEASWCSEHHVPFFVI